MNSSELQFILRMRDEASAVLRQHATAFQNAGKGASELSQHGEEAHATLSELGKAAKEATEALIGLWASNEMAKGAVEAFEEAERALLNIQRQTDMTHEAVEKLSSALDDMDSKSGLAGAGVSRSLAAMATNLGGSQEKVLEFVKSIEQLGKDGSNVNAIAQSFLKIQTITGSGDKGVLQLADAIAALQKGSSTNQSTEQIARMTEEMTRATQQFKIGTGQLAAYGAAAADLGLQPLQVASSFNLTLNWDYPAAIVDWKAHAISCFPNEAVGAILQDGTFAPLDNKAPDPRKNAVFDLMALINKPVAGIVHSHTPDDPLPNGKVTSPTCEPSQTDMENQVVSALPWGISVCMKDSASDPVWWGDSLPIRPMLGRPFLHGITDCFSLIRDWHRLQGVTFPDFPRGAEWWKSGQDLYAKGFEAAGFVRVERSQPLPGDCFITKVHSKVLNHAGIYLGKGLLLQHLANSLSRRSPASIWKQKMDFLVRHKDLPEKEVYDVA